MFVLSIVSIREDMRLGIQNGAGRGTVFLANTACMLVTALILNIAFFVVTAVWNQFDTGVYIVDFFGALSNNKPFFESIGDLAISTVVLLALSVFLSALGTFTSLMYWRLNKLGKWIVSIGMGAAVILFIDVIIRYKVVADLLGRLMGWGVPDALEPGAELRHTGGSLLRLLGAARPPQLDNRGDGVSLAPRSEQSIPLRRSAEGDEFYYALGDGSGVGGAVGSGVAAGSSEGWVPPSISAP